MARLNTARNIARPDETYSLLIRAHEGLSKSESDAFNARLVLLLINHIGDEEVIAEALKLAGEG
ncbi:MAG: DUF2783 domain-containing protein [Pararhodobacter sp.]